MSNDITVFLPAGHSLTMVADAVSSGYYAVIAPGEQSSGYTAISASTTTEIGPFNEPKQYIIASNQGEITYSTSKTAPGQDNVDIEGGTITDVSLLTSYADNATSRRLKGLDYSGAAVQSYEGIFYDNSYDTWGAVKTRYSIGSNTGMDIVLQASNDLLFLCTQDGDSGSSDIKFMTHTDSGFQIHFSNDLTPNIDYEFKPSGLETSVNVGTVSSGVTAVEYGDGHTHKTVLTLSTALPDIAGGAAEAEGVLLYTLPAGAHIIESAYMSVAITQTEGNINADTPDVGLGTGQASGANATLDADATYENILTGQTAADANGTATVKTIANQVLVVESGDAHTIYFNAADNWAAGGDAAAAVAGTVVLVWRTMA